MTVSVEGSCCEHLQAWKARQAGSAPDFGKLQTCLTEKQSKCYTVGVDKPIDSGIQSKHHKQMQEHAEVPEVSEIVANALQGNLAGQPDCLQPWICLDCAQGSTSIPGHVHVHAEQSISGRWCTCAAFTMHGNDCSPCSCPTTC